MAILNGYIIRNQSGGCLTSDYLWYNHEKVRDSWVHPKRDLEKILTRSQEWDTRPTDVIPAVYSPSGGTRPIEDPINIRGLEPREALAFIKTQGWD